MNLKEEEDLDKMAELRVALVDWLRQRNPDPKLAAAVLSVVVGDMIGFMSSDRDEAAERIGRVTIVMLDAADKVHKFRKDRK